jgi:hypothetical protein
MSKLLAGIAGLSLVGLAAMPVTASAAEPQDGVTNATVQSTDLSSRHRRWHHRRYGYRYYYGPRRYWGPRYGYYGYPYGYPYYSYYRPAPLVGFGVGPFGFRVF